MGWVLQMIGLSRKRELLASFTDVHTMLGSDADSLGFSATGVVAVKGSNTCFRKMYLSR